MQLPASASSFDHDPADGPDPPDANRRQQVRVWLEAGLMDSADVQRLWRLNYHEASVYLAEGQANDKLHLHPSGRQALRLYLLVHSATFHRLHLLAAILLLALGLCEQPAVTGWQMPASGHALIELSALFLLAIELMIRLRWTGVHAFVRHTRSMLASAILALMITESIFVLVRQDCHFRPTRALRPLFLIDSAYCGGVRRVLRQILQSLPPVLDMLVLLLFCILVFALSAFYLFSDNPSDPHFATLERSFVSLFVLLTTAKCVLLLLHFIHSCKFH
jgi:two pore calcium channel protein 1